MTETPRDPLDALKWPLRLTAAGLWAERAARAFWPLASVVGIALALAMLGLHETAPTTLVWVAAGAVLLGAVAGIFYGARRFRRPRASEVLARLDATLPGRPLAALRDRALAGAEDPGTAELWRAHLARMAERARQARPVHPDLRLARFDPFALRYVAVIALAVALMFGSLWRVGSISEMGPGGGPALAAGPSWEGWAEPPAYTGRPALYLNDITRARLTLPEGTLVTLRAYGGDLSVRETVSAVPRTAEAGAEEAEPAPMQDGVHRFEVARSGTVEITGPAGRRWEIGLTPDRAPEIAFDGPLSREANGEMAQPFVARDDYGVVAGRARVTLDLAEADRRYGLASAPDPREPLVLDLPMSITGDRRDFGEVLVENLSEHPWANLPVTMVLLAEDAVGNEGASIPMDMILPGRRFFDPLAQAVIEQRRDLLWARENAPRVAQVLRAVSHHPDDLFRSETSYLRLRVILRRLETFTEYGLRPQQQEEIAKALWDLAIQLEEGDLSNALERLRRAQERLSEAMENGASEEEIAELMQELREAMQDYMRQLAEQTDPEDMPEMSENMQSMSGDQLQQMLERIEELMRQGRMDEAQALLDQLQQMMENMQIARGQQGQQGQSEGQQALNGLAETLREQQELSDESFRELQEQFNRQREAERQQGQQGQQGQQPGQPGQGQQPGQPGQQQGQGQQPGEPGPGQIPGQPGEGEGSGPGTDRAENGEGTGPGAEALAERQQALRDELERQRGNLPGAGTPEGDAAREALGRAGEAMDGAEDALRADDLARAIDEQAEAMDALREGMQNLGEALAQQQQQPGQGQQGEGQGTAEATRRDPLGREQGNSGQLGTGENLLQGEDVYRRADELLEELRRRSAETERPQIERDYIERLLDRF
jgi:uncharacterized protein (TIGR02302 family)